MTWEQMVENYPDMWVAILNPVMDGDHPDILEGDVVDVIHFSKARYFTNKRLFPIRKESFVVYKGLFYWFNSFVVSKSKI